MEPLEAVMVLILTVLLMFIVMSPSTWSSSSSSAARAAACDDEMLNYPASSCISSRLDFVFSPSPPCTPFPLFDDEPSSSHNDSVSTAAIPSDSGTPCAEPLANDPALPLALAP